MAIARKAHVYRVFQTDSDGNVTDPDIWLDVLRIDKATFNEQRGTPTGASHQDRTYEILWGDNTTEFGDAPDAPSRRTYEPLTVTQPPNHDDGQSPTDPALATIVIPLIQKTWFRFRGSSEGLQNQEVQWVFRNDPKGEDTKTGRKGTALRITNNDLNNEITMPEPNIGDPQPPIDKDKQISWDDYSQAIQDGEVDDTQYVDVSVTDKFSIRFPPSPYDIANGLQGIKILYQMVNEQRDNIGPMEVEDLFQPPPDDSYNSAGTNNPGGIWRTDPFQAIVNVSWGGLAVKFGDKGEDAPAP